MNINFRETSTKRGIVMIITGCTVLYQTIWGSGQVNIDALFSRVDWWLGVGLNIVGMLGLLPDRDSEKRTRATDLPNIELQGRAEAVSEDRRPAVIDQSAGDAAADQRLRVDVPPDAFIKGHEQSVRSNQDGYSG